MKKFLLEEPISKQRLEAFSDGVFAIAITLLILEIKIPHIDFASGETLASALAGQWASYLGYVVSFLMIGIYWVNHHNIFRFYRGTDHFFNLLNLFFLMTISFLPFPTAILSEYIEKPGAERTAVMFYAFGLLLPTIGFALMWFYASGNYRLIDSRLKPEFIGGMRRKFLISMVINAAVIVLSYWLYWAGLTICILITLIYLLPSREPELNEENLENNLLKENKQL
jgi:uncharacterized membrane protein